MYQSNTKKNFIVFIIVLGQHVSILIESSSGPSKIQILIYYRNQSLNTRDKSHKVRQEYDINIKKVSLTKRNYSA